MGRGLSELQKVMISLAWDAKEKHDTAYKDKELVDRWIQWDVKNWSPFESKPMPAEFALLALNNWTGAVFFSEVFKKVYGWTPKPDSSAGMFIRPAKFSKTGIGQKKYMAAYIAVRKAAERLEKRGLIKVVNNNDYYLTDEGKKVAVLLTKLSHPAKKDDIVELRYLRDIDDPQVGGVWHPKGEIIQVDKENAKRMLTTGIWEVVAPIG